ncbi:MAG TPA: DUF4166 domain-containing protein [Aeromonadales bacterium]|nr:DUF4166 domain-containing protein [Aeromonadales bacterium]
METQSCVIAFVNEPSFPSSDVLTWISTETLKPAFPGITGINWKMHYLWQDNRVKLIHIGYVFNFFGHFIPLPVTFLMGKGYAEEKAIDENTFGMKVQISHPWWGIIYQYNGTFKVTEMFQT